jgi:hypothetical protein
MVSLLLCLVLGAAPPGPPSLEDAARRHGPAIVGVWSGESVRPGFFVSSAGIAVTVVHGEGELVIELADGERRKARVLVRDDDGLALVEVEKLEKDSMFSSLAVASAPVAVPKADAWLMAMAFVDGRPSPSLGGMRRVDENGRWRLDLPVDAGAPVIVGGRVIGVVVQRAGTTSSVAVPSARITALAKRIPNG